MERRYYRSKLKNPPENLKLVGIAQLELDYFITGSETKFMEINSLSDISVEYRATLESGTRTTFEHNVQELLRRAKEGIMTYISFSGFRVSGFIVKIKGNRTLKNKELWVD